MKKIIITIASFAALSTFGREKVTEDKGGSAGLGNRVMAGCAPPKASKELWFNNVRTIIYSGGDMWWDLNGDNNAYYYIPAVQNRKNGVSSSFAGSIWLGGLDAGGQLKVAAMTYRQTGVDFYPGPLDTVNASVTEETCSDYDQIFTISRSEVDAHFNDKTNSSITPNIANWPGNGDVSLKQGRRLAPFIDVNFDGFYEPGAGDYPAYDVNNLAEKDNLGFCKTKLFGDYTLFWVFNDNGNIHTETQGVPIGVEVRAQSFAFKTNDEINNMTFYSYEIFNRSSFQLNKTYFTIWNDADLGYYLDDYVGCDVKRGLGYIYNADPFDETASGVNGYQDFPPSLGCDFFKGPLADAGDAVDNDQDGITDEAGETIQMSRFTYYNNNIGAFPPQTTNPQIAIHFYNYMTGFWRDSSPFTFGGNAYGGTAPATYVYDGDPVTGTGWTEKGSGNLPGDRRFLQSAGPFTLKPGAVNEITFGMPWAQSPTKGGNMESLTLLKTADDKAQALFDNCFKLLDGPEAPNMTIQEMSNELIFYLTNEKGKSNNYRQYNNDYAETDITIVADPTSTIQALKNPDKVYRFEGYIVYQVKDDRVTSTDLADRSKAIPVFQCDVANGKSRLVNYELDNVVGGYVPRVKVEGLDKGITTTFRISEDQFSTLENRKLVNNKQYFFIAVAYAYNEYLPYKPDVSPAVDQGANFLGQKKPYLEGRKIKRAAGTPHIPDPEKGGTSAQAAYGFGPKITRLEGQGNGGNILRITKASEDEIVSKFFVENVTYENSAGPINIRVVDPLNVKEGDFTIRFINHDAKRSTPTTSANAMIPPASATVAQTFTGTIGSLNAEKTSWEMQDLSTGKLYYPNEVRGQTPGDTLFQSIKVGNEIYFPDLGFSINVKQESDPGELLNKFTDYKSLTNDPVYEGPRAGSYLGSTMEHVNGPSWLIGLPDVDSETPFNWILSGNSKSAGFEDAYYSKNDDGDVVFMDPNKQFGKILGGTWAPYPLVSSYYRITPTRIYGGPGFSGAIWSEDSYFNSPNIVSIPSNGNTDLRKLSSTLIVITRDKSKWTRCVVLEMQEKSAYSEGKVPFFHPRKHGSVDKNGNTGDGVVSENPDDADFIAAEGMGWFPGYAINLETGERLNMAFGEDSYQKENNGNDMVWNPTGNFFSPFPYAFGGKHFIYVFGNSVQQPFWQTSTAFGWEAPLNQKPSTPGRYDHGKRTIDILKNFFERLQDKPVGGANLSPLNALEREIMWVSVPLVDPNHPEYAFTRPENMPADVRVHINVAKPYRYGFSGMAETRGSTSADYPGLAKLVSVNTASNLTQHVKTGAKNGNFPMYSFNTSDIATLYNQSTIAKNALDLIKIVPNPYYGSSTYETRRTDNIVRITNLPNQCTIKIYTMNGTLVRTIKRDVTGQEDMYTGTAGGGDDIKRAKRIPYVEWDLKNQNNISVASGLYIFHIDAPGIGEKILKWFGAMRPLDVQNY
jgi:hypothetical protein